MAYTVLARRYRSSTFDEVIGQDHVARTLKRAIEADRIAHAFLFNGTRGVGKTSMARIMAKALNCESADRPTPAPCGKCESCRAIARGDDIDVIEIDAASHTGVDNIRELIENSQYRPARSRFKVYIIDEVHMLSKSAFNALLKTLEEPPEHVKFILATTEPEKVLPTILSRCQRYDFGNIPTREIASHLREICQNEKIEADEDALLLVAKAGAGSMRDSLSLLDRLLSIGEKRLTAAMIEQLLGLPRSQLIFDLAQAIGEGDVKSALMQADAILQGGLSADALAAALVDHLRNLLVINTCGADSTLVEVPGLAMDDLRRQAERFDPVALTQDIVILEELRRQLRTSQAGRALIDATLVRLALAEQFAAVADLMARVNGSPAGAGAGARSEKKKPERVERIQGSGFRVHQSGAGEHSERPAGHRDDDAPTTSADADADDDDLPRPGKVWEGPSLAEALKQPSMLNPSAAPSPPDTNVAIDPNDLPAVWQALLKSLAAGGPGLPSLLVHGRLAGIEQNQAIIRYGDAHQTLPKMLERNGKKDQVRQVLSQLLGRSIGVRFEVDAAENGPAAAPANPASISATEPSDAPAAASAPTPTRITPELLEQLRSDPLIRAAIEDLGGTVVKVE